MGYIRELLLDAFYTLFGPSHPLFNEINKNGRTVIFVYQMCKHKPLDHYIIIHIAAVILKPCIFIFRKKTYIFIVGHPLCLSLGLIDKKH